MKREDAADIMARARRDPVGWCRRVLGFNPWHMQGSVLESVRDNRRTLCASCHGAGKSRVAAAAALWFLSTHPRSIVLTTATTHRQVRGILWREMAAMYRDAPYPLGGRMTDTRLEYGDDWWAWGFTAPEYDPTRFQGWHAPHVLVIVDEAAGVGTGVSEGLESAMAGGHARRLDIGNPTDPDSDFARAFASGAFSSMHIDAFDTPNLQQLGISLDDIRTGAWREKRAAFDALPYPQLISPEWVAEKWVEWCGDVAGEVDARWQSRVRGRFPTSDERALFPREWVDAAMERHRDVDWRPTSNARVVLGCDVARFGGDTSRVAASFPGYGVRDVKLLPPADSIDTGDRIIELARIEEHAGHIVEVRVDADGLGAGVFDVVARGFGVDRVEEIRSGKSAQDSSRFVNARTEMLWHLREAINPRADEPIALPPDPELREELCAFRWEQRADGRVAAEAKEEVRRRIGRSPDRADAVAYAVARLDVRGESIAWV